MNRLLVIGPPSAVVPAPGDSTAQTLQRTGLNTGNLLIAHGLLSQLESETASYDLGPGWKKLSRAFDMLVFPAANFISPKNDTYGQWVEFIEKLNLPCLMAGLGAQAPSTNTPMEIPPDTIRFIKAVADRSAFIGVRGEYTADLLVKHGIHNVQITGCPSLYMNRSRDFRVEKPAALPKRILVNGSRNVTSLAHEPEQHRRIEQAIYRLAMEKGYDYILQNEMPEMCYALGSEAEVKPEELVALRKKLALNVTEAELAAYLRKSAKGFLDIPSWASFVQGADFSFGTRFHGNVIPILNGVPSLVLAHDSRTTELCRFFHIPHLAAHELERVDVAELWAQTSYAEFNRHYAERYDAWAQFVIANGATLKPGAC